MTWPIWPPATLHWTTSISELTEPARLATGTAYSSAFWLRRCDRLERRSSTNNFATNAVRSSVRWSVAPTAVSDSYAGIAGTTPHRGGARGNWPTIFDADGDKNLAATLVTGTTNGLCN